jgi:hypothetical protein
VPSGVETHIVWLQFFSATLELFYLTAFENLHAEMNGVENGGEGRQLSITFEYSFPAHKGLGQEFAAN